MLVTGSFYVAGAARAALHEIIDLAASGNGADPPGPDELGGIRDVGDIGDTETSVTSATRRTAVAAPRFASVARRFGGGAG